MTDRKPLPESVRTRIVETESEFESLAEAWEALQTEARSTSVFQTFDWQWLWWKTYGLKQPLRLVLAFEDTRLVGILPLYIQTVSTMGIPVRILRPIGLGGDTSPDDLGPVLAVGRENEAARALAAVAVNLDGWDVLHMSDLLPDDEFVPALRSAVQALGLPSRSGRSERIDFIDLPATWEGWLGTLSGDRRWRIRSSRKKLHAAHKTQLVTFSDSSALDAAIDRLVYLHNKRWDERSEDHGFATPEYVAFHRAVMHACLRHDRLRLYGLEVNGDIVAMYYFYLFRNRLYLMQSGFDPDFSKLKPGQVLLHHIIERAIEEKRDVLDFLRGDHRYKSELASGSRETVYVTGFRPTVPALVYFTRRVLLPEAKAQAMGAPTSPVG